MTFATSNFLVPNGTFIVVLLAFIIVLGVIGKKVLPILNQMLTERQELIRGELEAADKAKADAEEADVERRALLENARTEAREIVSRANTAADQTKLRAEADAQAIHDRIVQSADAEVRSARQAAVEEATARVGVIVIAAAERVIRREIQVSDHQDLIDEAISAIREETSDGAAGAAAGAAAGSGGAAAGGGGTGSGGTGGGE
jgi:F-type H+-transporting ATPase subunit b